MYNLISKLDSLIDKHGSYERSLAVLPVNQISVIFSMSQVKIREDVRRFSKVGLNIKIIYKSVSDFTRLVFL